MAVGSASHEVVAGGLTRSYRVYRPQQVADPAPLVFVFHGHGGSAAGIERHTGWNEWADRQGALIVYPEGVQAGFNAGNCCGVAQAQQVDDVAATLATIDAVGAAVPVDPARIYSTGFSNGASMSYRLGCETDRFAAIGPVAGIQYVPCESPSNTSVLHLHGLADATVPPAGQTRFDGTVVRPLEEVVAQWRSGLRCAPATVTLVDTDEGDLRTIAASCPGGRDVTLITLERLGHTWPLAADGLDATARVSQFFEEHRR
ncbi:polyhydroxybutyrate depolymerase [Kineosphaera limosa]|uniref:alpha/beta hydrolase family esterase n=1 Tax=Kineosphaera limosa TaxID=111564 RepID=UPI000317FB6F|nr:PHB depolymerase family esterase [Kineosphaera limosa]NYE00051.1 polyhydroxybutyrate depolymerase [Kineosphaera limosa]